jgi:hypothetical protein
MASEKKLVAKARPDGEELDNKVCPVGEPLIAKYTVKKVEWQIRQAPG